MALSTMVTVHDALEKHVDELLKRHACFDLKETLLNSLDAIAQSGCLRAPDEAAAQWQEQWMAQYGDRLPVDINQALELCNLALEQESSRKIGEDIRVMLPIPSGHFCENEHDSMAPVPLPAMGASWYPPMVTCDPQSDEEDDDLDDCQSESDGDNNPINVSAL